MLVSHNSFTYMKPLKWWMWSMVEFSKCQSKDIQAQKSFGIDCVDMRIKRFKGGWYVCHGLVVYISFLDAMKMLVENGIKNVRLLFEGKCTQEQIEDLKILIETYKTKYGIAFYEGRDKNNWRQLIKLPTIECLEQCVGSMMSNYGKVLPCLWNLFNRDKKESALEKYKSDGGNLALDFV